MYGVRPYHLKMAQNLKTSILPLRMRLAESQRPAKFYAAKLNFMQRFGGPTVAHRLALQNIDFLPLHGASGSKTASGLDVLHGLRHAVARRSC